MDKKNLLCVLILAAIGSLAILWKGVFFVFLLLLGLFVWVLSYHLPIGWYVLVFLSPMIHWIFRFDRFWYVFQEYPQLLSIHAPVVEFWAVLLIFAYGIYVIRQWLYGQKIKIRLPCIGWFALFLLSAFLSLVSVYADQLLIHVRYIFRFLVFFYVAYIVLGANIIQTKQQVKNSFIALALSGGAAALMGFVSFFLGIGLEVYGTPRSTPFALGTFAPFGLQHIFLAETITAVLPILVLFWYQARFKQKTWLGWVTVTVFGIGLLTLSRAGWITWGVGVLVLFVLLRKHINWRWVKKRVLVVFLPLLPVVAYFLYFSFFSAVVKSSTGARWYLTEISLYLFSLHPIIGNGFWSFSGALSEIQLFWYEIGNVTDAHGIIQKLLSEQGIVGIVTFGLFIWCILSKMIQQFVGGHVSKEARLYGLVGFFLVLLPVIFQLFGTQFYSSVMWVPISLALAQHYVYTSELGEGIEQ